MFLESDEYDALYRKAAKLDNKATVYMPRYLIIDKHGQVLNTDAPRPSEPDSIYKVLNKYLAAN